MTNKIYSLANRAAVVVTPKQPFFEWVRGCPFPVQHKTLEAFLNATERTIYLIPEYGMESEAVDFIKNDFYKLIFSVEITSWYRDEKLWPRLTGYKMFNEWFDVKFCSMIIDPLSEKIEREEYLE